MDNINLETRPSGVGPIFVGSYRPSDTIESWEPEVGNVATLRSAGVAIEADITFTNGRNYKGKVIGSENWSDDDYDGPTLGDEVKFSYEHIFVCSR